MYVLKARKCVTKVVQKKPTTHSESKEIYRVNFYA